ncbi:hypothetical protein BELL_0264g00020 [Botrytis elliptica]|uniref:CENP-T/Histone H4 histone fold domain-containing protein n=1 Tax=Botrytis elliptica TaxID=278938 RepID=A0A4Z1JLN5_9HELO|nr:hypothetical protein BELL_0264g00020 [Botrytis elliptica]
MSGRPETPLRRTSTAGLSPTDASYSRTPSRGSRLGGSEFRTKTLTPHGRAALREVEARRAGLTPGKDRRRSGRQQRETPRDVLRLLSRTLAPQTRPTIPSPQRAPSNSRRQTLLLDDDFDDGPNLVPPRLSIPLDDDNDEDDNEDDESLLLPSLAALEDENLTTRSIELSRRAVTERPSRLFSRGSFGSIRGSDQFGNLDEADFGRDEMETSFFNANDFENDDFREMANSPFFGSDRAGLQGELETALHRRSLLPGRSSDIRPYNSPSEERDATFVFTVPQPEIPAQFEPSPSPEDTSTAMPIMDEISSPPANFQGDDFEMDDEAMNGESDTRRLSDLVTDDEAMKGESDTRRLSDLIMDDEAIDGEDGTRRLSIGAFEDSRLSDDEPLTVSVQKAISENSKRTFQKKVNKVSKHGLKYKSLPLGVVKKHAISLARIGAGKGDKLSGDALDAIMQATDWFFEQISDDLSTYSEHAGRKTIDESDVLMLMRRQRQTNATTTPFSLAQSRLPRELLQDVRMVPPLISKDRPRPKPPRK